MPTATVRLLNMCRSLDGRVGTGSDVPGTYLGSTRYESGIPVTATVPIQPWQKSWEGYLGTYRVLPGTYQVFMGIVPNTSGYTWRITD